MKNIFTLLFIVVISAVSLFGCTQKTNETTSVTTVTTTSPVSQTVIETINATGVVQAWQQSIINAKVTGYDIISVDVNVGDKVHKGQILAKLNTDQLNADLQEQAANVAQAQANLVKANTEAMQAKELIKVGAISSQENLQYETADKTALATLNSEKAKLKLQQLNLSYAVIRAPDDGTISSSTATVGSIVQSGTELFRLIRGNRLEWQAEINYTDLDKIKIGQIAIIDSGNGQKIQGSVRQISPNLNQTTKSGLVYVDLPANTKIQQGTYTTGVINIGNIVALTVPEATIVNRDGYDYVMILESGNIIKQAKVVLGSYLTKDVVINSGVNKTDKIVVTGAEFLSNGDKVGLAKGSE